MTLIRSLKLSKFRNIDDLDLSLTSGFNFFCGGNGAGKTSLLESLYYLSRGRSFRASNYQKLIKNDSDRFLIYVELISNGNLVQIGFERDSSGLKRIKINGEVINSISEMVSCMTIIFLSSLSYEFFTEGPRIRRQYIDWLAFHVKPSFYEVWSQCQGILKQRNSAIKQQRTKEEVVVWDNELVYLSEQIDFLRNEIVTQLEQYLDRFARALLPNVDLSLQYERGWCQSLGLAAQLKEDLYKDRRLGYTQAGPHRADFKLVTDGAFISDRLSQGQLKVAIFALQLAMGEMLTKQTGKTPVYLLDDLASELDPKNRKLVVKELASAGAQVLVTGIVLEELRGAIGVVDASVFHVEQGVISPAVTTLTAELG